MNIRLFIAEVRKRRALWDQASRHYHNKRALSDGWRDIAKMFNVDVMTAKTKWKNLRDTFRVELKKTKRYSTPESDGSSRSMWTYYEDMYFLKNVLRTRRVFDFPDTPLGPEPLEVMPENVKIEPDPEITFSPVALNEDNDNEESTNIVIESVSSLHSHNEDVDTTNEPMIRVGKRKRIDDGDEDDQDDDLLFFRSLMPFVKRLDQDKKLLFRMNVQQMLYNQLYTPN